MKRLQMLNVPMLSVRMLTGPMLTVWLLWGLCATASAQRAAPALSDLFSLRGNTVFGFAAPLSLTPTFPAPRPSWTLGAHLEANVDAQPVVAEPVSATFVLDPVLYFAETPQLTSVMTEAFVRYRATDFEVHAGLERWPLETARLSVPYGLEPSTLNGTRQGLPTLNLSYYLPTWQLSSALFYTPKNQHLVPLLQAKKTFATADLTLSALYDAAPVLGAGGSSTVGELVLYAEGWLLTQPLRPRGSVGLSGYLGQALYTLEAAYLPPSLGNLKNNDAETLSGGAARNLPPQPALLANLNAPLGDSGVLGSSLTGAAFFFPDALRGFGAAVLSYSAADATLELTLQAALAPEATVLSAGFGLKTYF